MKGFHSLVEFDFLISFLKKFTVLKCFGLVTKVLTHDLIIKYVFHCENWFTQSEDWVCTFLNFSSDMFFLFRNSLFWTTVRCTCLLGIHLCWLAPGSILVRLCCLRLTPACLSFTFPWPATWSKWFRFLFIYTLSWIQFFPRPKSNISGNRLCLLCFI